VRLSKQNSDNEDDEEPLNRKRRRTHNESDHNSSQDTTPEKQTVKMHPRKNEFDQHPDEAIVKTTRYGRQSKQPVKYTDPVKSKRQLKEEEKEAKKAQEL
jgi:hypothetical protein